MEEEGSMVCYPVAYKTPPAAELPVGDKFTTVGVQPLPWPLLLTPLPL